MKACSPPMGARSISDSARIRRGVGIFALTLLIVLAIALAKRADWLDTLDLGLMEAAGRARDWAGAHGLTLLMRLASAIGGTAARLALLALVALPLLLTGRRRMALWLVVTVVGGMLLNVAIKQIFAAPRPDLLPHLDIVHTYSFPSGHAAGNLVIFGALAMLTARRSAWVAASAVILLIGASRVWLGVHWPSDVLAGWVEGVGWLVLCAVWLPARGGQEQRAPGVGERGHAVVGDEAMDPEGVERARHGDGEQQQR